MTVLASVGAVVGFLLLSRWWTASHGGAWLTAAGGFAVVELLLLRRWLPTNRSTDTAPIRPTLGIANGLTVLRGLLLAAVAGFLPLAKPPGTGLWVPAALYSGAVLLDYLDGFFARQLGEVTQLGRRLDEAMDTTGLAVAAALAVLYGQFPVWYLLVLLAKPAYLASLWVWQRASSRSLSPLPETTVRRRLAALQMVVTASALSPPVGPPITTWLAALGAIPFAALFVRDWFAAIGAY
ncbi:MAG: phosphatidylglycerophosphate synthase [Halorubrum sp. J07HR59]|nr:MAG: phosphatidylglycerophosphate synthase [Halorubrum sp. J07HR59]